INHNTRKQPNDPVQPPTGRSLSPIRARCTSPHFKSQAPYRSLVSSTAHLNASTARSGLANPRGVSTGLSGDQGSVNRASGPAEKPADSGVDSTLSLGSA